MKQTSWEPSECLEVFMIGLCPLPPSLMQFGRWPFFCFIEASFFPIPPDILMIPMVLAVRQRAWLLAGICTLFTSLGGLLGYGIGFLLYDTIGQQILNFYGYADKFDHFRSLYNEHGILIVIVAAA